MAEFKMPTLGADMEAGILYDWRVQPGDRVKRGDVIAAVETDKGVIDIEVFEDGVVGEILVAAGTRVPVGAALALIQAEGEAMPMLAVAPTAVTSQPQPALAPPEKAPAPARNGKQRDGRLRVSPVARRRAAELGVNLLAVVGTGADGVISLADVEKAAAAQKTERVRITPVARRVAEELGVDAHALTGSGPHGAVCREDVERAAAAVQSADAPAPPPAEAKPAADFQTGMRRAIAAAMSRSNRDIPHYYLETRIDMTRPLRWLEAENLKRTLKDRLLPVVLLIKATARALVETPELNGYWIDDAFRPQEAIHIGFAIALRQGGLVTPAIHNADLKSLDELMADMRDLIMRTRNGRLRSSELTDPTITLTSLGDRGVEKVYGVIYPPQVALVGFGKIAEQPWAENGMLGVRPVLTATLAADHRASDGHRGGLFLEALQKCLQEVEKL